MYLFIEMLLLHTNSIKSKQASHADYIATYLDKDGPVGHRTAWWKIILSQSPQICLKVSPCGVEVEHWFCNPRVSGSVSGANNLKKLFIWMKIHGLTQNS